MNNVQVSIIVACRNEIKHIRTFLDSILAQDMAGMRWEVIIADGMSDDGTRDIIEQYALAHPEFRLIDNRRRIVSTGLNAAIRASRGEIILRMDAHTSYAVDYTRVCVRTLEKSGADNVGGPVRTNAVGPWQRAIAAAFHSPFSTGGTRCHDVSYEGWTDTVPYGCWRKETLERLGLFDDTLIRNQDDELNLRLVRAGGRIWQNPQIMSWYSPRSDLASLARQYFQYGFWKVAVIKKHRLPGSWRHAVPASFVVAILVLAASMLFAAIWGTRAWFDKAAVALAGLVSSYLVALVICSIFTACRQGWKNFIYLPAVFATYHLSWGLGFCSGMFKLSHKRAFAEAAESTVYTRISR
jgi:succinoglycan biosynthesis protein ExoA